jgi:hypothetical protein
MKCDNCGYENKKTAKFCTKCGAVLKTPEKPGGDDSKGSNTKYIIVALVVVILVLVGCVGYFAGTMNNGDSSASDASSQSASSSQESSNSASESSSSAGESSSSGGSKSWESIGTYSGSGSGSQTVKVPAGKIMVKLSAYPILNYATNHLYVKGSNGESGGVDWGSYSDVETRSDSFTYTSSSSETFTIDYYETVSWEVEFYRYQ